MKNVFKQNVGVSGKRFDDNEVIKILVELWNAGKSKGEIARRLNISHATLNRNTKGWTRDYVEYDTRRTFDYHIAYCLLHEHGLTYKEASQALGVKESSLLSIMSRNKNKLQKSYPIWKKLYTANKHVPIEFLQAAE